MHIEIIPNHSPFKRVVYEFYISAPMGMGNISCILNRYSEQSRESHRHSWKSNIYYNRIETRQCNIKADAISIPKEVTEECKKKIIEGLEFKIK